MQPPVCRVCGAAHWPREPHRFRVTNDGDKPIKVQASGRDVVVGPKEMSDEELKPYYLEWMRREMSRRRGKKM